MKDSFMSPLIRQSLGPVIATVAVHGVFLAIYLGKFGGDVSALVSVGENHIGEFPFERVTKAIGPSGHDGQFYYSLARDPWHLHGKDIDMPPLRHVRVLYPALCWALSGGDPVGLFYVMPVINLLAAAGLSTLAARAALAHGRSAWWGFILPLGVNTGLSVIHNFTDCISNLAVFGLLAAWLMGKNWMHVAVWGLFAVFAREQNIAVLCLVGLAALWKGRHDVSASLAGVAALWVSWVAVLWLGYGCPPYVSDGTNLSTPLAGLLFRMEHLGDEGTRFSMRLAIIQLLSVVHLVVLLGAGVWVMRWPMARSVCLLLGGGVILALSSGTGIYSDFSSYLRVFVWVPMGLWLAGLATGHFWPVALLTPGILWSLAGALRFV
jgi:hypothetical protein